MLTAWKFASAISSLVEDPARARAIGQAAPIPVRNAAAHWPELFERMPA